MEQIRRGRPPGTGKHPRAAYQRDRYAKLRDRILAQKKASRLRHHENDKERQRAIRRTIRGRQYTLLKKARERAKTSNIECTITLDDIMIPERCPVLGIPIVSNTGARHPGNPSLDRHDNSKGYVPGNVHVISLRANLIKNNATPDELERVALYAKAGLNSMAILPSQGDFAT